MVDSCNFIGFGNLLLIIEKIEFLFGVIGCILLVLMTMLLNKDDNNIGNNKK